MNFSEYKSFMDYNFRGTEFSRDEVRLMKIRCARVFFNQENFSDILYGENGKDSVGIFIDSLLEEYEIRYDDYDYYARIQEEFTDILDEILGGIFQENFERMFNLVFLAKMDSGGLASYPMLKKFIDLFLVDSVEKNIRNIEIIAHYFDILDRSEHKAHIDEYFSPMWVEALRERNAGSPEWRKEIVSDFEYYMLDGENNIDDKLEYFRLGLVECEDYGRYEAAIFLKEIYFACINGEYGENGLNKSFEVYFSVVGDLFSDNPEIIFDVVREVQNSGEIIGWFRNYNFDEYFKTYLGLFESIVNNTDLSEDRKIKMIDDCINDIKKNGLYKEAMKYKDLGDIIYNIELPEMGSQKPSSMEIKIEGAGKFRDYRGDIYNLDDEVVGVEYQGRL